MDGHVDDRQTNGDADEQSKVYRDLRRRNERRAGLARTLKARRRQWIERDMEAVRRRRFHSGGRAGPSTKPDRP